MLTGLYECRRSKVVHVAAAGELERPSVAQLAPFAVRERTVRAIARRARPAKRGCTSFSARCRWRRHSEKAGGGTRTRDPLFTSLLVLVSWSVARPRIPPN